MIHSAKPIVSPVANIVFAWNLFSFKKWERTDDMCKNNDHCGSTSRIKKIFHSCLTFPAFSR